MIAAGSQLHNQKLTAERRRIGHARAAHEAPASGLSKATLLMPLNRAIHMKQRPPAAALVRT